MAGRVGERVAFGRRLNQLVTKIADNMSSKDCDNLCFIFADMVPVSFRERHGDNALRLLEKLKDARVFSNDKPDRLANLMGSEGLDLPQMQSKVDAFIS